MRTLNKVRNSSSMEIILTKLSNKQKIEINLLIFTILFFIFRTAFPLFKYPFILLFFSYFFYAIISFRKRLIKAIKGFAHNFYLLILLAFILLIAFILSDKIYLLVFKELADTLILFGLFVLLMLVISDLEDLQYFIFNFIQYVIVIGSFICVFQLLEIFNVINYTDFNSNYDSLNLDYNFALLPDFFAIFGIFYFLTKKNSKYKQKFYNVLLILFFIHIFLSGSRRGIIILITLYVLIILALFVSFIRKSGLIKTYVSNIKIFLFFLIITPIIFYFFATQASYNVKQMSLEYLGSKETPVTKATITWKMLRYITVFRRHVTFNDLHKKIWSITFDPNVPGNGWGKGHYRIVYPLSGENVEIVPAGAKGYLLDKTCKFSHSSHHAYAYTLIGKAKVKRTEMVQSSIFCYVSDDFNGDKVCINTDGSIGTSENCYDLSRKGRWQKLMMTTVYDDRDAPVYLYFNKMGVIDFSTLTGYVIFAYPQYKVISNSENKASSAMKIKNQIYKSDNINLYKCSDSITSMSAGKINNNNDEFFLASNPVTAKTENSQLFAEALGQPEVIGLVFVAIKDKINGINDLDPVRNLFSKIISEDTTYHGYSAAISIDTLFNPFLGQRLMRWQFALEIYAEQYSLSQKLFGGGFNFLNWYGYYFLGDKTRSDHPHNPLLFVLLYSGLFGLSVYLILMVYVFKYYIKYLRYNGILFVFFLVTLFFTFFSGDTPFNPPMMGFYIIFPFFAKYIIQKVPDN
jgi:hypothetical protein